MFYSQAANKFTNHSLTLKMDTNRKNKKKGFMIVINFILARNDLLRQFSSSFSVAQVPPSFPVR
jgi:hypothetical protein